MANGMDKDTSKKTILMAAALGGVIMMATVFFLDRTANTPYLSFAGLEESDSVNVRFQAQGQAQILASGDDNSFKGPDEIHGNYLLNVSIEGKDGYRDILFGVNQETDKLILALSGFSPGEVLNLRRGDEAVLSGLHFDWAGRIEIDHDFSAEKAGHLCLETGSGFSACHLLPGGNRA